VGIFDVEWRFEPRNEAMTLKHSNSHRGTSSLRIESLAGRLGQGALEPVKSPLSTGIFLIAGDHPMNMAKGAPFRSMLERDRNPAGARTGKRRGKRAAHGQRTKLHNARQGPGWNGVLIEIRESKRQRLRQQKPHPPGGSCSGVIGKFRPKPIFPVLGVQGVEPRLALGSLLGPAADAIEAAGEDIPFD